MLTLERMNVVAVPVEQLTQRTQRMLRGHGFRINSKDVIVPIKAVEDMKTYMEDIPTKEELQKLCKGITRKMKNAEYLVIKDINKK